MECPGLKTKDCCCVFGRETGAKLIGVFYIVLFTLSLIGPIIELNRFRASDFDSKTMGEPFSSNTKDLSHLDLHVLLSSSRSDKATRFSEHTNVFSVAEQYDRPALDALTGTALVLLIIALMLGILVNGLMVWGAFIRFCWLLTPWLAFQIVLVVSLFFVPPIVIYCTDYQPSEFALGTTEGKSGVLMTFFPLILGLVSIYFWQVVRRLFDDFDSVGLHFGPKPGKVEDAPPDSPKKSQGGPIMVTTTVQYPEGSGAPMSPAKPVVPDAPPKIVD